MTDPIERFEGRATIPVTEAAAFLGISRRHAYSMAHRYLDGEGDGLPVLKFGSRYLVPVPKLLEMVGLEANGRASR